VNENGEGRNSIPPLEKKKKKEVERKNDKSKAIFTSL
jgi:hypothetical protein